MKKYTVGLKTNGYNEKRNFSGLNLKKYSFKKNIDLYKFPAYFYSKLNSKKRIYYWNTYKDFNLNKCDLLHFFNGISMDTKPWISTFESTLPKWGPGHEKDLRKGATLLASQNCKRLIAFSESSKKILLKDINKRFPDLLEPIREKVTIVHPSQELHIHSMNEKKLPEDLITFTVVGAQFFRKGGREILNVFDQLIKEKYPVKLIIVSRLVYGDQVSASDENDFAKAQKIIESHPKQIEYYKSLPNEEVLKIFLRTHVGLLPTFWDSYGYSVLEGQACGCPIITTDIMALTEINSEKAGWFLKMPKNEINFPLVSTREQSARFSEELSSQLYTLIKNIVDTPEVVVQKGQHALDRIKNEHIKAVQETKIEKIYDKALFG